MQSGPRSTVFAMPLARVLKTVPEMYADVYLRNMAPP